MNFGSRFIQGEIGSCSAPDRSGSAWKSMIWSATDSNNREFFNIPSAPQELGSVRYYKT